MHSYESRSAYEKAQDEYYESLKFCDKSFQMAEDHVKEHEAQIENDEELYKWFDMRFPGEDCPKSKEVLKELYITENAEMLWDFNSYDNGSPRVGAKCHLHKDCNYFEKVKEAFEEFKKTP